MAIERYNDKYASYQQQIDATKLQGTEQDIVNDSSLFEGEDMVKIIKMYLEENIPEEVKKERIYKDFWVVFGKKIQLTFLENEDKYEFEALFEQARCAYLMSIPEQDQSFAIISSLKQLEIYFAAALRSAVGTKTNKINERTMLATTITQQVRSNTDNFNTGNSSGGGGGMFGWLKKIGF